MSWKIAALAAAAVVTAIVMTDTPASAAGPVALNPGTTRGLNPQPLPPRTAGRFTNPGSIRALNPQPLPPRTTGRFTNPGSIRALNPQPLPPRWAGRPSMR